MTNADEPVKVAVVGGGCASIAAAFELTRPEHGGKYQVTVYQLGWRLGGKGASGRGVHDRIEEHGLHVWLGFYENAFRLLRECYRELGRDPRTCRLADWTDAFLPDPHLGFADRSEEGWLSWTAYFPPGDGMPGDPLTEHNPFTLRKYLAKAIALLRTLLLGVEISPTQDARNPWASGLHQEQAADLQASLDGIVGGMTALLRYGALATTAALIKGLALLDVALKSLPDLPETAVLPFAEALASGIRGRLEAFVARDHRVRHKWEIIDLVLAIIVGAVRFRLLSDPRGLEAIDEYECREWLRMNGAAEGSLDSAFVRGLYDLALAYEGGDPGRPGLAAGQALRGSLRMFFSYRGALLWKMRAGMGDVVFAPFYEVLKRRGV
ncbi:MAG: NAD(P)-binding protein, partial [Acetobacteraceae bacterium]|nr:NAD(P)-binding protein [Acetobacteraceae bacterium]